MKAFIVLLCIASVICQAQSQGFGRRRGGWLGSRRPPWCGPQRFCFANPCTFSTCPNYPGARCYNDDPCDRACTGHFYYRGWRLQDWQCNWGRR